MADEPETGGAMYDAPNQQVVRPDGSAPWDEGKGGSTHKKASKKEAKQEEEQPKKQEEAKK
jgi:hypothetical protein